MKEEKGFGAREVYSQCAYKFTRLKGRHTINPPTSYYTGTYRRKNKIYPITHLGIILI